MTQYVIKATACHDITDDTFWAENVNDETDYAYLTKEQVAAAGGTGAVLEAEDVWFLKDGQYTVVSTMETAPVYPDPIEIAADDGMQAAIGAAHAEPHDEAEAGSVVIGGEGRDTDAHMAVLEAQLTGENEHAERLDNLSTEQREAIFAEASGMLRAAIFSPDFGNKDAYLLMTQVNGEGTTLGNMATSKAIHNAAEFAGRMMGMPAFLASLFADMVQVQAQSILAGPAEKDLN